MLDDSFRSPELAERFRNDYDELIRRWPAGTVSLDVAGRFGTTRVYRVGPIRAPTIVLLHGGGTTSAVWFSLATELAADLDVVAPDRIGDAGYSIPAGEPIRRPADLIAWVDELLDALGIARATLVGHSYGGWIALTCATNLARVQRLVLVDPTSCFAGLRIGYRLRALPVFAHPSEARMRALLEWEEQGTPIDPVGQSLTALGGGEFRAERIVLPHVIREDVTVPTVVVLAARSRAHDIRKVADAARLRVPRAHITMLPEATHHTLPIGDAHHVAAAIRRTTQ